MENDDAGESTDTVETTETETESTDAGNADSIYDDLLNLHNQTVEKLTEMETAKMAMEAELSKLKAQRFDALMETAATPPGDDNSGDTEDESDPDNPEIDDLWNEE